MNAGGGSVRLELLFAAPVPAGNEILWYRIHQPEAQRGGEILLDRTASTLYCDENVAFLLQDRDAVFDPLKRATQFGWKVMKEIRGRVTSAVIVTASEPAMRTALWIETVPAAAPYR